jgi:PII-like signaling protein
MASASEAARLRIYIDANDVYQGRPLADVLIEKARDMQLAGAVAMQGVLGYAHTPVVHSIELILSRDRPLVVELVDRRETIDAYLAAVEPALPAGLATVEPVTALRLGPAS